jgi:hypothetical protein
MVWNKLKMLSSAHLQRFAVAWRRAFSEPSFMSIRHLFFTVIRILLLTRDVQFFFKNQKITCFTWQNKHSLVSWTVPVYSQISCCFTTLRPIISSFLLNRVLMPISCSQLLMPLHKCAVQDPDIADKNQYITKWL